ncbi:EAL domain-containing protein [Paenochrobactrum sp. BZR 588]|uniref:EAL domain-containing protein n=1 Tax=unclassified Paenochrobactrum TaxID=2639760 RepID=UPI0038532854
MFDEFDTFDHQYVLEVASAIDSARMSFHIQGIHCAQNRHDILYHECLVRMAAPNGELYNASEFVPALEVLQKTSLLDLHMIGEVLNRLEADQTAVLGCNISADTVSGEKEWPLILDQIQDRKHLTQRLVLEIIETRPLGILSTLADRLEEAQSLGCRIAIDDFGAGYLPPIQLYSLNPDIIKIDAGFIWATRQDDSWLNSIHHFVQFATSFAPIVVAEGIETESDLIRAEKIGFTHVQGWHLSKPVSLPAMRNI